MRDRDKILLVWIATAIAGIMTYKFLNRPTAKETPVNGWKPIDHGYGFAADVSKPSGDARIVMVLVRGKGPWYEDRKTNRNGMVFIAYETITNKFLGDVQ